MASSGAFDRPIRVGTFNLHHGAPPGRSFDQQGLRRSASRLGVDLLELQEVDRRVGRSRFCDQARLVASATGLHAAFAGARRLGVIGEYGIALLAATPPTAVEVVPLPSFGAEPRVAIVASVELRGRRVSVAATHLQNRAWIAERQLPVVLEHLMARPGPHLLLGDLNAGPDRLGAMVRGAGLVPSFGGPTFPTRAPTDHIDWIAAGGLSVDSIEVPGVWASDHFPMVAALHLP